MFQDGFHVGRQFEALVVPIDEIAVEQTVSALAEVPAVIDAFHITGEGERHDSGSLTAYEHAASSLAPRATLQGQTGVSRSAEPSLSAQRVDAPPGTSRQHVANESAPSVRNPANANAASRHVADDSVIEAAPQVSPTTTGGNSQSATPQERPLFILPDAARPPVPLDERERKRNKDRRRRTSWADLDQVDDELGPDDRT